MKKQSLRDRLRKAGIRHYDELIHDQPKEWLIQNFSEGATDYPVNVARLMRNIVWQTRERIIKGERISFRGFGSFIKEKRSSRKVRHPKTGKIITIPERITVDFDPSNELLKNLR